MIDFQEQALKLKQSGVVRGLRPVFIKILKGDYPYKGKYLITIDDDKLRFYQLGFNYRYKGKKATNFYINISLLEGFHFSYYKEYYKKIMLMFKDGLNFEFAFMIGYEETTDNEPNMKAIMQKLKEKGVPSKNLIKKDGANGQKAITKTDQYFTQEIRGTQRRRGFFG